MIIDDLKRLGRDELLRLQGAIEVLLVTKIEKEPEPDRELTVAEAREELRIGKSTIYEEIRQKRLPAIHYSPKCIRILQSDLRKWKEGKAHDQRAGA